MVLIQNMDSDEEQLQIQTYEEPEAYAVSTMDNRPGIKMIPKVPPQFDGQSSWFENEDLIDDWFGITTLDADKHSPSLKNALVGAASFYKSMLGNALLQDPDRGLSHFKDALRPYFVKGVNHGDSSSCFTLTEASMISCTGKDVSRLHRRDSLHRGPT